VVLGSVSPLRLSHVVPPPAAVWTGADWKSSADRSAATNPAAVRFRYHVFILAEPPM
jgi:hypothetical protein